ncbi:hypothetical protein [Rhodopirellula sp. MGV]|uniref:hypothetical protein n=1 Tax=Rhodopirellula sp. MGV TaxID=2023130 RepID=UPI000BD7D3CA|nr:hypothetical protein [Rhodopirellula sp. MGV]OYP37764.1 hypothetical protein CGZ80_04610 [Rhodopirellula sp. MGV]
MWLTAPNRIGIAGWQSNDSVWRFDSLNHDHVSAMPLGASLRVGAYTVGLCHPGDQSLPALDEQFVRADELHQAFPQTAEQQFGYGLMIRPVAIPDWQGDENRLAFEWVVSVQTTLLDSHPTIDLLTDIGTGRVQSIPSANAMAYAIEGQGVSAAIILGAQDAPFTDQIESPGATRLRLFGQFLEKGVIRRARPWVLVDRSGNSIDKATLTAAAQALATSPIPLN